MMRLSIFLLSCLAALSAAAVTPPTAPSIPRAPLTLGNRILTKVQADKLIKALVAVEGCNANVCFAIDGSGSINSEEFEKEKEFVLDVSSVISVDHPIEMAAVQYGTANTRITPLTASPELFNERVDATKQVGGQSFVTGGLNYCIAQLARRPFEANKVILLGDGIENIGSRAARRAKWFRDVLGGDISVVTAGIADEENLLDIVGGDATRIYEVGGFLEVLDLQIVIEELTLDVCGINPKFD